MCIHPPVLRFVPKNLRFWKKPTAGKMRSRWQALTTPPTKLLDHYITLYGKTNWDSIGILAWWYSTCDLFVSSCTMLTMCAPFKTGVQLSEFHYLLLAFHINQTERLQRLEPCRNCHVFKLQIRMSLVCFIYQVKLGPSVYKRCIQILSAERTKKYSLFCGLLLMPTNTDKDENIFYLFHTLSTERDISESENHWFSKAFLDLTAFALINVTCLEQVLPDGDNPIT